jgi:hypothetical protein
MKSSKVYKVKLMSNVYFFLFKQSKILGDQFSTLHNLFAQNFPLLKTKIMQLKYEIQSAPIYYGSSVHTLLHFRRKRRI